MTRTVQWNTFLRQPSHGDTQSTAFTGPEIVDCSNGDLPDSHCCRHKTTFWVSRNTEESTWWGNPSVTKCREICETQFLRTGEDSQCVPVQPECNDWNGDQDASFLYSDLLLLEAYCLCGMKLSVVPFARERRLQASASVPSWNWPSAHASGVDIVSGGHFQASDQCYRSSINFQTRAFAASSNETCPTNDGSSIRYTEMAATQISFTRGINVTSPYPQCSAADPIACCVTNRVDSMATHYYSIPGMPNEESLSTQSAWRAFGQGVPFGASPSTSRLVFAFDLNQDGMDDVVVGNRIYLSRGQLSSPGTQDWETSRHVGKAFTSGNPVAMDAVVVLNNTIYTAIAYEDNSIVLYTIPVSSPIDRVVLTFSRVVDDGTQGVVSAIAMYTRASTDAFDVPRSRLSIYVAYTDADDQAHILDIPDLESDRARGYVTTLRTTTPTLSTSGQSTIPTLDVVASMWPTKSDYTSRHGAPSPPPAQGAFVFIDVFFVATPIGFHNAITTDNDGFLERPISSSST